MAGATAKAEPIKKEQLDEYASAAEEAKALEQKARAIRRRLSALADHFKTHLEAKKKTTIKKHGYQISLIEGRPEVSYKDTLIDIKGALFVDELLSKAPRARKVHVEKVA